MRFMITNDDGYDAPGLQALYGAVAKLGEVVVVAPAQCQSCKGHALTSGSDAVVVRRQPMDGMGTIWVADGTPADCTQIALVELLEEPPDVILSGINAGANLGVDVYYSGTVAAAREAAIFGRPAIAISQFLTKNVELDWAWTQRLAEAMLQRILQQPTPAGCLWNINLPALPTGQWPESLSFVPTSTDPEDIRFRIEDGPSDGERTYHYNGSFMDRPVSAQTDVELVFAGHAVATLLQLQTAVDSQPPIRESFPQPEDR